MCCLCLEPQIHVRHSLYVDIQYATGRYMCVGTYTSLAISHNYEAMFCGMICVHSKDEVPMLPSMDLEILRNSLHLLDASPRDTGSAAGQGNSSV